MCGRNVVGILKVFSIDQALPLPIFSSAHLSDSRLSDAHLGPPPLSPRLPSHFGSCFFTLHGLWNSVDVPGC